MIVIYDYTVIAIVNYNRKTFKVQTVELDGLQQFCTEC
jgi:hypothetical protein